MRIDRANIHDFNTASCVSFIFKYHFITRTGTAWNSKHEVRYYLISFSKEFLGLLRVTLDHHCRFRLFRKPRFLVQRKHKISVSPSLHLLAVKCSTCVVSKRRGTCTVQVPAKLNLELHAHQLTNEWRFK
jgi:hypothetical protein